MNPLVNFLDAKRAVLQATLTERMTELLPVLLFVLLLIVIGGFEGNAWRRGRLYAGYYHLIFLSAALWGGGLAVCLAGWLIMPHLLPGRLLPIAISFPALFFGWSLTAGRPVLR